MEKVLNIYPHNGGEKLRELGRKGRRTWNRAVDVRRWRARVEGNPDKQKPN